MKLPTVAFYDLATYNVLFDYLARFLLFDGFMRHGYLSMLFEFSLSVAVH